ncbi:MAG: hypothetical protein SV760_05665 [Halobacteria archaeon]|nr:hypothetical protein [Halobacteria archaeon]
MTCEHDLDPEYLHPSDARVLEIYENDVGNTVVSLAVPCPNCDETLKLEAPVEDIQETTLETPLDEGDDIYD